MKTLNVYGFAFLLASSAVAGCATTGAPVAKGEEEEAAAAKNETAPKPPSDDKIQQAKQQQAQAKKGKADQPKISASAKAEFDAAVKKWETAKASKTGVTTADCKGLASNFSRISDGQLAAQAH